MKPKKKNPFRKIATSLILAGLAVGGVYATINYKNYTLNKEVRAKAEELHTTSAKDYVEPVITEEEKIEIQSTIDTLDPGEQEYKYNAPTYYVPINEKQVLFSVPIGRSENYICFKLVNMPNGTANVDIKSVIEQYNDKRYTQDVEDIYAIRLTRANTDWLFRYGIKEGGLLDQYRNNGFYLQVVDYYSYNQYLFDPSDEDRTSPIRKLYGGILVTKAKKENFADTYIFTITRDNVGENFILPYLLKVTDDNLVYEDTLQGLSLAAYLSAKENIDAALKEPQLYSGKRYTLPEEGTSEFDKEASLLMGWERDILRDFPRRTKSSTVSYQAYLPKKSWKEIQAEILKEDEHTI